MMFLHIFFKISKVKLTADVPTGLEVAVYTSLNQFKQSWQKQIYFLPKYNKFSNIIEKSTNFFAE